MKFTYWDVTCMNAAFYLFGSGLYWWGAAVFVVGSLTSGLIESTKRESR